MERELLFMTNPIVLTVLFFSFCYLLLSYLYGWSRLVSVYRYKGQHLGDKIWGCENMFTVVFKYPAIEYRVRVWSVSANFDGLYISAFLFYPAVFIPWSDITMQRVKPLFFSYIGLTFRQMPNVTLYFPVMFEGFLKRYARSSFPYDEEVLEKKDGS